MKERGITTLAMTNTVGSTLASISDSGVYLNGGYEFARSSTKSFLNTCICLAEVAVWYSYRVHNELQRELRV
jgi:glucosamine 6-phosphate synthetase-like amidotransferase/phosphosugar isomerase protein